MTWNRASRNLWIVTVALWFAVCGLVPKQLSAQELTAARVADSIKRAMVYLENAQSKTTGRWSSMPEHRGGVEALVTLSLLLAGTDKQSPTIKRSLRYLDGLDIDDDRLSVYTVSLLVMVYCELDADLYRGRIRECVEYLVETQKSEGNGQGGWAYNRQRGQPDGSNTQFAILALSDAAKNGIDVDQQVWQRAQWYWESAYRGNGRFIYRDDSHHRVVSTGSMVCAAIASLIIIDDNLSKRAPLRNGRIICCEDSDRLEMVEAANQWMKDRFTTSRNPADNQTIFSPNRYYYLYSMERAARLSGQRFFGKHDWYREGASTLLTLQRGDGRWSTSRGHGETNEHVATALALLFLAKGRRPIVIGKYKHANGNDWDRHRKGVHYLTRALEADWELKLSWQTIDGQHATATDLSEAQVLFISGRDSLRLNQEQKEALREYVEYGGFIFAEACQGDGCGDDDGFDRDFRALMEELFPGNLMQPLDANHPVFNSQYKLPANPNRPLWGLQSSCRTSVIYCPRNLAGFWRFNRPSFMEMLPATAKTEVDYTTRLGINVVSYATGRELKDKLDGREIFDVTDAGLGERIVLIPKLAHSGGADAAPNAWQNILRRASFDLRERFKIQRDMIVATPEQLADHPMAFMHGRTAFTWSAEERQALRDWFEQGQFLFVDTICSASGFANSFRNEMKTIFPEYPLVPIPANDRIWSEQGGGYQLDSVAMHEPGNVEGGVRRFRSPPQMEGIKIDGRWVVVFSPHDLSCAMENGAASQCAGYDKDDAARLGVNVILYALKPGP